ncbi:TIGR02680 family protein [Neobacillus sp. OS1-32]|uniref:TIGR02680 family protein n=1 Tax=Neobacillus sp. OS1-32 TaxID=3070682 RepID=UPI0027E1769E|nr:TIGR02680 family protein [Neobacillus sp. OS1-32]WML31271.1 TIGR02680 family protein [Neobacillus sp. OS1-32]
MTEAKWVMNRAGLLNFWYYDDEVFHFSNGKLLLRGTNGSGKSVTMQSFLPVLLDGKKTPDRLDPFGSKARRMEDYLLGEKEVVDRDERTGYLFIEYKLAGMERYITTGIGMQAKRYKGIKSWYFVITDNRRIGYDLQLTHNQQGDRVPFSAKELENRIGEGGFVVHSQREYMELVNKYIFGFQSIEAYEDLIKLLIQLRSPKLSKDFKPTVIYEILESALPPLTDDELRSLSDTIESMDQTQQQLEQLEREYASSERLVTQYHFYNQYILAERAAKWQTALKRYREADELVKWLTAQVEKLSKEIEQQRLQKEEFVQQREIAAADKQRLERHEVWNLEEEKRKKIENSNTLLNEIRSLQKKWDLKNNGYNRLLQEREQTQTEIRQYEVNMENILGDLEFDAEEAAFLQHEVNVSSFERHQPKEFDFSIWLKEIGEHEQLLSHLKQLADEEDRLLEEHNRLQRQSSEKKREVDELRKNLDHLSEWFIEEKQKLEHSIFSWMEEHAKLTFTNESRQEIARAIEGLYEENRYDQVREKLFSAIADFVTEIRTKKRWVENSIEAKVQEIEAAKADLHYWKTLKMPNPERAKDTEEFRAKLLEDGLAYVPFYAAVEFQDHLTEEQRERVESALKQTGILDSLITEKTIAPNSDRIIRPEPQLLGYTLADYLRPDLAEDSPISNELVDEVLRSIPVEKGDSGFHLDVDGSYSLGCLVGHAPNEGPSKYIGRSSRKRYQQEKVKECEQILEQLQLQLQELNIQLREYDHELAQTEVWKQTMPTDQDLSDVNLQIEKTDRHLEEQKKFLQQLDEQWKMVHSKLQAIKLQLHQHGGQLNLSLSKEVLAQAEKAAKSYRERLYGFKDLFLKCLYARKRIDELLHRLNDMEAELDELKGEQNVKESQLRKEQAEVKSIEEQLKLKGIDEVRQRIQQVQRELTEAEAGLQHLLEVIPKNEANFDSLQKERTAAETSARFWSFMAAEWEQLVNKEINRNFVEVEEIMPDKIIKQLEAIFAKYDRSKLNEQLTKAFINEQVFLTEYRMFEYTEEAERPEWFLEAWGDYYQPFMDEWHQLKSRRLILMEYKGQRVSPYFVNSSLKKELADQKSWLDEQDRQLYEDIIVNSVGVILRNRIKRAEQWVSEMDKIMESRDNSSGLTFSIAWKPLTAESEQEMDTKDLVKLLQRNSKFLNEDDLSKITMHFRSRIEKAKELIQLRNEGSTLHQVLKEVLDYRKWFTFVLSYKRVNEPKRELTNNAFFKFSGGEKAMAMYIPLFTAAYSRYKEAAAMAPYIISLDEAFAGVDENNIRDMFEVVEQLGFNYIMNSQSLWGDYDTISSLSICELVRPKNADFVTLIRYQWDGKQRTLVVDQDPLMELVPNE